MTSDDVRMLAVATGGVAGSVVLAAIVGGGIAWSGNAELPLVLRTAASSALTMTSVAGPMVGVAIGVYFLSGRSLRWLFAGVPLGAVPAGLVITATVTGGPETWVFLGTLGVISALIVAGPTMLFMGLCLALPRRAHVPFTATAAAVGGVAALSGALTLL